MVSGVSGFAVAIFDCSESHHFTWENYRQLHTETQRFGFTTKVWFNL